MTDAEELVLIDAAITRLLAGSQEYSIGEIRKRNVEYQQLVARKKELTRSINKAAQGGLRLGNIS